MFQTGPVLGENIKGQPSRNPLVGRGRREGHSWDNQGHQANIKDPGEGCRG